MLHARFFICLNICTKVTKRNMSACTSNFKNFKKKLLNRKQLHNFLTFILCFLFKSTILKLCLCMKNMVRYVICSKERECSKWILYLTTIKLLKYIHWVITLRVLSLTNVVKYQLTHWSWINELSNVILILVTICVVVF